MEHESFFEKQLWQFWVDLINNYVLLSTEVLIERTRREVKLFISTLIQGRRIDLHPQDEEDSIAVESISNHEALRLFRRTALRRCST
ncbi:uncharacterized protein PHALS_10691 [Plasmopara halstedii]|uniref:Uncharacterized protein n=1 Tax=Plasmopara halstedii TaxID=4781 RepID=A0A0P1AI79_PLAHL|nr:uncharacterized protein PHALS_10691 [Plasmopara halstedii]CEG40496.1 hypothetical protein PHALS_10691 [Plasmopara halstedii]|eukprot:XP_024576865.1 hypothetical protein PHALS_10691 [Plasmopara halstedii]